MNLIRYVFLCVLLTASLCTVFFVADKFTKTVFGLGDPIVYDEHPLWGYSPRANKKYIRFDGKTVTINNAGTRSIDDWNQRANNLLFLGDSITYGGSYINDDETFSALVCQTIIEWKCYNAGVNAYGILNMIARSRYDDRINNAPIRVFTFITEDFDRGLQKSNTAHFILREPPKYFSGLWELLNFVAAFIEPKNWFGKKSDKISDEPANTKKQQENRNFSLDIFVTEIERLKNNKQSFLLVHSPTVQELDNPHLIENNKILSTLRSLYPKQYISLSEVLLHPHKNNTELLYKDAVHFDQAGHKVVAEYLIMYIRKIIGNPI